MKTCREDDGWGQQVKRLSDGTAELTHHLGQVHTRGKARSDTKTALLADPLWRASPNLTVTAWSSNSVTHTRELGPFSSGVQRSPLPGLQEDSPASPQVHGKDQLASHWSDSTTTEETPQLIQEASSPCLVAIFQGSGAAAQPAHVFMSLSPHFVFASCHTYWIL